MSRTVKIAALQMLVTEDVAGNEGRILEGIARAASDGADFLLTPEGSLSGYTAAFDRLEVEAALARVTATARGLRVGLALGTCFREVQTDDAERAYNQVRVYAPEGEYLGSHAKILRCSSLSHPGSGEMQDFADAPLRTFDWNGLRFGCLVCNDLWATPGFTTLPNPYLAWQLQQLGAQFILHAINSGRDLRHQTFLDASAAMWSRVLDLPIVQINAMHASGEPANAPSGVVLPDGSRPVQLPADEEGYFVHGLIVT